MANVSHDRWKPIDTAPMDGTPVWAICMQAQNPTARVSYHALGWQVISPPEKFSPPGPHRWWPTHWQPLEPPHA